MSKKATEYVILCVLLIASSGLILARLGNIYLWQDEAQTALLAKTVLKYGFPRGFDGMNYFSLGRGMECGPNFIWKWHPWFPFYLLAGFFAVLGKSTFVARLPFALFGIATIVLTYYYAKSLWVSRRAGIVSAVLLLMCVPFLLLIRQCKYHAPEAFFSLAGLYAYSQMLEDRKRAPIIFVLAAVFLFHSHYVCCATLLATSIIYSALWRRDKLRLVILLSAITMGINLPWVILFSAMGGNLGGSVDFARLATLSAVYYLLKIIKHIFHPALLGIPVAVYVIHRIRHDRPTPLSKSARSNLALLLLFVGILLIGTSLTNKYPFFRYLAPIIPVACIVMGLIIESGMKIHPAVGMAAIGLLAWWWRMPDYLYEITHDYDGPIEEIVLYLNANARPGDVVTTTSEELPLMWYTGLKVISGSSGEDFSAAPKADWIVYRRFRADRRSTLKEYINAHTRPRDYRGIMLPYADTFFENREDPALHRFRTVKGMRPVTIYQRIAK
ncbi:MAG TPA: glycosyltransferase family 39 protein [Armatimonadota bacterium]|nr:glycosyltransferase family 39 protein [Armatimonadota bacterium]